MKKKKIKNFGYIVGITACLFLEETHRNQS